MTPDELADFNRIAHAVSMSTAQHIIDEAEASQSDHLAEAAVFYAAINGAATGVLRVLEAAAISVEMTAPADELFDTLIRQMTDCWHQAKGQPAQTSGALQ